ncbi:MAG: family 20 glycosylhydrolase [Rhodothermales bacterium]
MHCQNSDIAHQPLPEPAPVALKWQVISHLETANSFTSELTIKNLGAEALTNTGWILYFNFIRMIDVSSLPETVQVTHINGDFFKMEPTASFPALGRNEEIIIPFLTNFWAIKKSDAPAGFYMVYTDESGNDGPPKVVAEYTVGSFETPAQTMRSASDEVQVPTPASRFAENAALSLLDKATLPPVIPTPTSWTKGSGMLSIDGSSRIRYAAGLENEADFLATALERVLTTKLATDIAVEATTEATPDPQTIHLQLKADMEDAYHLSISPEQGVTIAGADPAGVFYGIQSLRSMIPPDANLKPADAIQLPAYTIQDRPKFEYRGLHIDVSRNFHTKASILKVLDIMALYKLNKFHFHLTDDEGWRLAIKGLPELTDIGSKRGHTLDELDHLYPSLGSGPYPQHSNGSGHYSREDFIEILQFAHERHIEVIPEIDLPGHARAAIKAMEARYTRLAAANDPKAAEFRLIHPNDTSTFQSVQLWNDNVVDVCQPSTYAFIEHVTDDLIAMYDEAGMQLETLHIGNDEVPHGVWEGSPACAELDTKAYNDHFLTEVHQRLDERGLKLAGWEEIAFTEKTINGVTSKEPNPAFVSSNFRPYVWNAVWGWGAEGNAYKLANAGYEIVISNATNLYFDFAYDKDPDETGFYWAGFSNTKKAFAFNPLNLYQNASESLFGQRIDPEITYRDYPRLTAQGRQNILGIQGQLWSESAKGAEVLEYQLFPKVLGLAERAWAASPDWFSSDSKAARQAAETAGWNVFANQLGQRELPRLDALFDMRYRIPPPGVTLQVDKVEANVAFPGLTIRYTTEDRAPTADDPVYTAPVPFEGLITFSAFSSDGRSSRPAQIGAKSIVN